MIKTSDFLFKYLVEKHGITDVFLVTGGGAMHLNDSIGRNPDIRYICNHHEQASAIAAEGYYRASGKLCVTNVTTGPGGTNAVTGVLGQWTDSIPAIYISGQVKQSTTIHACPDLHLRQLGDQEANIIDIVKPITKFAEMITDANDIKYYIDKAIYLATHGRPGPVWIDVPLDVQAALIEEENLKEFDPSELEQRSYTPIEKSVKSVIEKLKTAKRPVFYVGNGLRLAGVVDDFIRIAEKTNIPVVTAISGHDIIWHDHPLFFGKPGICGDRIGNVMVQNSDLLIILGTRLGIRQIGYAYEQFAPSAYKIMVDIDACEMSKPTFTPDMKIHADLNPFIKEMESEVSTISFPDYTAWINWGNERRKELPTVFEDNPSTPGYISSYVFADELFKQLKSGDVVVTGNGTAYTSTYHAMHVNKGVRVFANQGCAAMGYDLPAAIGAAAANKSGRTILITGDGSIQMNIQELQTLLTFNLPVKIFVLENEGYLAIKTTQKSFFNKKYTGSNPQSGVICPDMAKIAGAYGIPFVRIHEEGKVLKDTIAEVLASPGVMICEITMDPEQTLFPKSASSMDKNGKMVSSPLERMFPFLPDEEQQKCTYPGSK